MEFSQNQLDIYFLHLGALPNSNDSAVGYGIESGVKVQCSFPGERITTAYKELKIELEAGQACSFCSTEKRERARIMQVNHSVSHTAFLQDISLGGVTN